MAQAVIDEMLFGPDMLQNPFPVYRHLQETDPVHWDARLKAWIVTSHADVSALMKDRRFSSDRVSLARHRYADRHEPVFDFMSQVMLQTDNPQHKRLRDHVHGAFTRTSVETYDAKIRELCRTLLAPGIKSGEMEFASAFASPLPILVISEIVGIPAEDRQQIKIWCDAFSTVALNFYVHISDDQLDYCGAQIDEFRSYLMDKVEAARKAPGPDLLSSMAIAADENGTLTMDEVIANCVLLLNAGNETTTCLLTNGLGLLLEHPEQLANLRDTPERIPNAVEEFLRLQGPVQFLGRIATEDIQLGNRLIRAGDMAIPVLAAANRDPRVFDRPDTLDVTRTHIRQLDFGTGPHMCAGIQLVRLEAKIAFEVLLDELQFIELTTDQLVYGKNYNMRCLESLPIRVR